MSRRLEGPGTVLESDLRSERYDSEELYGYGDRKSLTQF